MNEMSPYDELLFPAEAICDLEKAKSHSRCKEKNVAKMAATESLQKATLASNKIPEKLKISNHIIQGLPEEKKHLKFYCVCPLHDGDNMVSKLHRVHVGRTRGDMIKTKGLEQIPNETHCKLQELASLPYDERASWFELLNPLLYTFHNAVFDEHEKNQVVFACPKCNHKCDNDKNPGKNFSVKVLNSQGII